MIKILLHLILHNKAAANQSKWSLSFNQRLIFVD